MFGTVLILSAIFVAQDVQASARPEEAVQAAPAPLRWGAYPRISHFLIFGDDTSHPHKGRSGLRDGSVRKGYDCRSTREPATDLEAVVFRAAVHAAEGDRIVVDYAMPVPARLPINLTIIRD